MKYYYVDVTVGDNDYEETFKNSDKTSGYTPKRFIVLRGIEHGNTFWTGEHNFDKKHFELLLTGTADECKSACQLGV